jgi:hypothetical protein
LAEICPIWRYVGMRMEMRNSFPLKASHTRIHMEELQVATCKVQEFPIHLLGPSNRDIGNVLGRAFEPLAPPSPHITLFWLRELQRIEIALQKKLNQDPDAVHTGLLQVMRTKMVDYPSFVKVKKSLSIFINLWEKTFCRSFSEFYDESSNQLVLSQLKTIRGSRTGELDEGLLRLLSECYIQMNCSSRIHNESH